jgi:hypothetical protein
MAHDATISLLNSRLDNLRKTVYIREGLLDGTLDPTLHKDPYLPNLGSSKLRHRARKSVEQAKAQILDYEGAIAVLTNDRKTHSQ